VTEARRAGERTADVLARLGADAVSQMFGREPVDA
jgi:hypothetical protein